jgi:streptogramin lyase
MDNDVVDLDRELRTVLFTKAEGVGFAPVGGVRMLRRARRRIARNAVITGAALAVAMFGVVGITRALSTGEEVNPKPRPAQTPPAGLLTPFGDSPVEDLVAGFPVGESPTTVALGEGSVWVLQPGSGVVSRIDPNTNAIARSNLGVPLMPAMAVGFGSAWVVKTATAGSPPSPDPRTTDARQPATGSSPGASSASAVFRVDPASGAWIAIDLPESSYPGDIAVDEEAVWVLTSDSATVFRIDPATNRVVAAISIPNADILGDLVALGGEVWVYRQDAEGRSSLVAIDPTANRLDESRTVRDLGVQQGLPLTGLAAGEGSLWATECFPGRPDCTWEVLRMDPDEGRVVARIPVGGLRNGILDAGDGTTRAAVVAVDAGRVWVVANTGTDAPPAANGQARILEIDPGTNEVVSSKDVGDAFLYDAAFGDGAVWAVDIQGGQVLRFDYRT